MSDSDRITIRGVAEVDDRTIAAAAREHGFSSKNAFLVDLLHRTAMRERNAAALARLVDLPAEGLGTHDSANEVREMRDTRAAGESW